MTKKYVKKLGDIAVFILCYKKQEGYDGQLYRLNDCQYGLRKMYRILYRKAAEKYAERV